MGVLRGPTVAVLVALSVEVGDAVAVAVSAGGDVALGLLVGIATVHVAVGEGGADVWRDPVIAPAKPGQTTAPTSGLYQLKR